MICLYLDFLSNTPLSHNFVRNGSNSSPGPETPDTTRKVEAAEKQKADVGDVKDAAVKAPTRTVVARPRLPTVMAAAQKPPMVVPPRLDATGVARRINCTE